MAAAKKQSPVLPPELWTMIIGTFCPPNEDIESYYHMYLKFRPVSRLFKEIVEHFMRTRVLPKFDMRIEDSEFSF